MEIFSDAAQLRRIEDRNTRREKERPRWTVLDENTSWNYKMKNAVGRLRQTCRDGDKEDVESIDLCQVWSEWMKKIYKAARA